MDKREKAKLIERIYSLSPLQEGLLFHKMTDQASSEYVLQDVFKFETCLDTEKIEFVLKLLSIKYEVLRTMIVYKKVSKARQVVLKERKLEFNQLEITDGRKTIAELADADVTRGFDFENDTLMRLTYVKENENLYYLIFSFHHIIMDGWCGSIVYGDFFRFYQLLLKGTDYEELEATVKAEKRETATYEEYIKWVEQQDTEAGLFYWKELLGDYEGIPETRALVNGGRVETEAFTLSADLTNKLLALAKENHVTMNTIAETGFGIALQKQNGIKDIVFGKVVSGRNAPLKGMENMVGLFINTIPARVRVDADSTIAQVLKEVQKQAIESNAYDFCSLAEIQSQTQQSTDLIQAIFVFQNFYEHETTKEGGEISYEAILGCEETSYPLSAVSCLEDGCFVFHLQYNAKMYQQEEIKQFMKRIQLIYNVIAEGVEQKVSQISVLTKEERDQIDHVFNATKFDYPREKTVMTLFEEQVKRTPNKIALMFEDKTMTYFEMNQRVNAVSNRLRELGVKPNDFVVIMAERSFEMIIGIYGILKSGGAYVPMDSEYPKDRILYMLEDCHPKAVLTYQAELSCEVPVLHLEELKDWMQDNTYLENPTLVNKANDLSYIIYTSGTTGKPKGVLIEHGGLTNLLVSYTDIYKVTPDDVILQVANYIFDQSVWDIFNILLLGGILCIVPYDTVRNPKLLAQYCNEHRVTIASFTPALITELHPSEFETLRILDSSGEAANREVLDRWVERGIEVINTYGPTEYTVNTSSYIYKGGSKAANIPIGKPIYNTQMYIVDGENLCGIGIPGELCVAGYGMARGYLNRPDLTAEKFIPNPFGEGVLYRTGDLAKWLPDGNIECQGRMDEQVKIRGFRIELGEIENVLRKTDGIKDCAVIVRKEPSGEKAIYAYVVSEETLDIEKIRMHLTKTMPDYMIPAYMMQIDAIPVTRNGKLNRRELPEIKRKREKEYIAPRNDVEQTICEVVGEILGLEKVSVRDSFFELGGNSIKIIRLEAMLMERDLNIDIKELYQRKRIYEIAEYFNGESEETFEAIEAETAAVIEKDTTVHLDNIQPFNEIFFNDCIYTAYIPAHQYYGKSEDEILLNTIFTYRFNPVEPMDIIENFTLDELVKENGIQLEDIAYDDSVLAKIKKQIDKKQPVVASVDPFYNPEQDIYHEKHMLHYVLIYGYDDTTRQWMVLDHTHWDTMNYDCRTLGYDNFMEAHAGSITEYGEEDAKIYGIVCIDGEQGSTNNSTQKEERKKKYIANIQKNKEELEAGVERLKVWSQNAARIISTEETLKANLEDMVEIVNSVQNAKKSEQYLIGHLFGEEDVLYEQITKIIKDWEAMRIALGRYQFTSVYSLKRLTKSFQTLEEITELEEKQIQILFHKYSGEE